MQEQQPNDDLVVCQNDFDDSSAAVPRKRKLEASSLSVGHRDEVTKSTENLIRRMEELANEPVDVSY